MSEGGSCLDAVVGTAAAATAVLQLLHAVHHAGLEDPILLYQHRLLSILNNSGTWNEQIIVILGHSQQ